MSQSLFVELLNKYMVEDISREENIQFFFMLEQAEYQEMLKEHINKDFVENTYSEKENLVTKERLKQKLAAMIKKEKQPAKLFTIRKAAAAAAIIFFFTAGGYFYFNKKTDPLIATTGIKNDVAPGRQGAILTLSTGKTIVLDTAQNGKVLGNFTKFDESIIVESAIMQFATLITPKARTQQLTLADGSKVWLNSESSIYFPTLFSGKERKVEITGEVYFEIAHNAKIPFRVSVNGIDVEVLGTHFNINAYADEATVKTTLLEGSIRVTKGSSTSLLTIGKQAEINKQGEIQILTADIDEVIAWKNGLFQFESADLKSILKQLARWYDVEIVYEGSPKEKKYFYIESKSRSLASVLQTLKAGGIKFRIEGKKLFVEP